jgi:hypothetical protein
MVLPSLLHEAALSRPRNQEPKRGEFLMTHAIGRSVDSWCARCKLMLAHTIEAIVNDKITRAHCNTCGAQHAYRRNPPGPTGVRARAAASAGGRSPKASTPVDYRALLQGVDAGSARRYNTSDRFHAKEIIHHPTFGLGLVVAERDANKIDVGFADGMKTLTHQATAGR